MPEYMKIVYKCMLSKNVTIDLALMYIQVARWNSRRDKALMEAEDFLTTYRNKG